MVNNYKKAFNLSEILTALVILGVLITLTITNAKKQLPDMDKIKLKKAYTIIEQTVSSMLNDEALYPSDAGLTDLSPVETEFGEKFGFPNKETKFRDAFKFLVNPTKDNINCPILGTSEAYPCFKTTSGIVFGIPDTDFINTNINTVTVQRAACNSATSGDTCTFNRKYVPITIYTNWDDISKTAKAKDDAFFIGVSYNGEIRVLTNIACTDKSEEMQCKAAKYLQSDTYRQED